MTATPLRPGLACSEQSACGNGGGRRAPVSGLFADAAGIGDSRYELLLLLHADFALFQPFHPNVQHVPLGLGSLRDREPRDVHCYRIATLAGQVAGRPPSPATTSALICGHSQPAARNRAPCDSIENDNDPPGSPRCNA